MDLLKFLIEDEVESSEIAPVEERNHYASISDPDARARKEADARRRYYIIHRTAINSRSKQNRSNSQNGESNS